MVSGALPLIGWLLLCGSAPLLAQATAQLEGVDLGARQGSTFVRLRFDQQVDFQHRVLGETLFIEVEARGEPARYHPERGLVRDVEVLQPSERRLEFRLRLQAGAQVDIETQGPALIVQVEPGDEAAPLPAPEPAPPALTTEVPAGLSPLELEHLPADLRDLRIDHITLDPGHGGHDPGAYYPRIDLKEKDIVLDIALKLEALLKDRTPTRVALTRRGDYFVDLSERTLIANQHRSDLFVSLHCNASPRHDAHGTEVFFFSEKPSNRAAELVALRENGPAPAQTRSQTGLIDIDEFLLRAERRLFWRDGEHLARRLQHRLVNDLRTLDRQVKSANFLILREARMPAVLVEVAFVDHPADAHRLKDDDFRWEAAQSILRGIHRMIAK